MLAKDSMATGPGRLVAWTPLLAAAGFSLVLSLPEELQLAVLRKLSNHSLKLVGMTCTQLRTAGQNTRRDRLCRRLAARWRSATRDAGAIRTSTYIDLVESAANLPEGGRREVVLRMAARFQTTRSADVWRMPTSYQGILAGQYVWHLHIGAFAGVRRRALAHKMKGLLWNALQTSSSTWDAAYHEIIKRWSAYQINSNYAGGHDEVPDSDVRQCSELMALLLHAKFCLPPELIGACPTLWQASLCHLASLMARIGLSADSIKALADATFP